MAKFNTRTAKAPAAVTPIVTTGAQVTNARGGVGFERDTKSELFILGISNFVGEKTFHEGASARDQRFAALVSAVAVEDQDWLAAFLKWLRTSANMRSASLTGALIGAKALIGAGKPGGRQLIASVLTRADEPAEALAFWISQFGRKIPAAVKRGVADAVVTLYSPTSLAKYDSSSTQGFRFGDVIQLTHPKPKSPSQDALFKYALDFRYDAQAPVPAALTTLTANRSAKAALAEGGQLSAEEVKAAGLTWQNTMSQATDKKAAWEAQIPSMGYMALLRNLRNFDQAGIGEAYVDQVIAKLTSATEVARSRQFPYRFLSAYKELEGLRWASALERALTFSLASIPELSGRTLILVDRSGSMFGRGISAHSKSDWAEVGAVFGTSLAIRNIGRSTLVEFGTGSKEVSLSPGASVLTTVARMRNLGGTDTFGAIRRHFAGHDRIVIITDEQHQGSHALAKGTSVMVPIYTFNLAGYAAAQFDANNKHVTIGGGLTDAAFRLIPLLEGATGGQWPWETEDATVDSD